MSESFESGFFSRYRRPCIAGALFILQLILIWLAPSIPGHRILFMFFFFNMVIVPGYFLTGLISPVSAWPARLLLSFVFGAVISFVFLLIFAVLRLDLMILGVILPAVSVTLAFAAGSRKTDLETGLPVVPRLIQILLVLLLVLVSSLVISNGDPMSYISDSAGQISYIRAISRTHEAFPIRHLYAEGGKLTNDIRKGLMHSLWGALNLLTGRNDVMTVWPLISMISSVFTILAFFCAGWFIFRSPGTGLLSAAIFVFIYGGGLTSFMLITAAFSFPIGKTFSIVFLISVLCWLREGRKEYLYLMAASALAGTMTHIGHLFVCGFIVFFAVAGRLIEAPSARKKSILTRTMPLLAFITVVVNVPYLLLRFIRDYAPNNDIHTHLQGIFRVVGNFYTLNPVIYYKQNGFLLVIGFLSIFLLWKKSREDESLRLLLWGNLLLWLLLFNPFLFPPLMKSIAYLVMRLKVAVPVSLLAAVLVKTLWDRLRGREEVLSTWAALVGWAVIIVGFGYQLAITPVKFAYTLNSGSRSTASCMNLSDIFDEINDKVPDGEVIISDPISSYCIPAFTDQYIVCTNSQHSIPNDSTALERIGDCRAVFSPVASLREIARVVQNYEAGYIMVNGRIPLGIGTMYWKPDRNMAVATIERLEQHPSYFKLIYKAEDAALFEIGDEFTAGSVPTEDIGFAERYAGDRISPSLFSGLTPSGISGIRIRKVRTGERSVERGGRVDIEIDWVMEDKVNYGGYVTHVRFDTEFEKGGLYREVYGKIYRKILEKKEGIRYRFRVDRLPFNGIMTPDIWPPLRVIKERISVTVPHDIAPGEYTISVKLSESVHYPNYSLRDLMMDNDSYDGFDVAKIIIM